MHSTGNSGPVQDFTLKCQRVQRLIHNSMEAKLMGSTSLNSGDDSSSGGNVEQDHQEDDMPWLDDNPPTDGQDSNVSPNHEGEDQFSSPPSPPRISTTIDSDFPILSTNTSSSIKTKNSTNNKRTNVGKSIKHLCDSIAKTSHAIFSSPSRSTNNDGMSQLVTFQFVQHQMQNQDRKIGEIKKMVKKMVKHNKK